MTDQDLHHRPTIRPFLAFGALLLTLAGCGSEPATPPAASTAAATAGSGGAQAAGQATSQAAASGPVADERLSTTNCQRPSEDRVHFDVGGTVFAVPGSDVRTVLPPGVTPATPAAEVVQILRTRTAEGAGCPEKPLQASLLGVAGPAGDPLLSEAIALFRAQPGSISTAYGNLTREMLASSGRCREAEGGLIACQAVEQEGSEQVQSLYLVSTDRNRQLAFGGPLAARCMIVEDRIRGCEVVDELPGGVGMRAPLRSLPASSDTLAAAHRAAVAQVSAFRL